MPLSLLFGNIDSPDIVPMDLDGLLFSGSSGDFLRLKHLDFLNESTDDFGRSHSGLPSRLLPPADP